MNLLSVTLSGYITSFSGVTASIIYIGIRTRLASSSGVPQQETWGTDIIRHGSTSSFVLLPSYWCSLDCKTVLHLRASICFTSSLLISLVDRVTVDQHLSDIDPEHFVGATILLQDDAKWEQVKVGAGMPSQHDRQHQLVSPVLRLVLCFTSLIDTTETTDGVSTSLLIYYTVSLLPISTSPDRCCFDSQMELFVKGWL